MRAVVAVTRSSGPSGLQAEVQARLAARHSQCKASPSSSSSAARPQQQFECWRRRRPCGYPQGSQRHSSSSAQLGIHSAKPVHPAAAQQHVRLGASL
eukprot:1342357-Alexandrium_andersonii.AAC.1